MRAGAGANGLPIPGPDPDLSLGPRWGSGISGLGGQSGRHPRATRSHKREGLCCRCLGSLVLGPSEQTEEHQKDLKEKPSLSGRVEPICPFGEALQCVEEQHQLDEGLGDKRHGHDI